MGEDQPRGQGRQLRRSTLGHQPGQYTELPAHGVEKPAFTIPDPIYDPELARHCAFPTIPLDQRPGPCEVFEAERACRQSAPEHSQDGDTVPSAGNSDKSDQDDNYEFVPIPDEIQEGEENESLLDPSLSCNDSILSGLERGESFKDFALSVTSDLDWGSPEPEQQTGPRRRILGPSMFTVSQEPRWSSLSEGVQWILIATVCKSHPFSPATRLLRVTYDECCSFIQAYIKYFDENAVWSEMIKNTTVSGLIQQGNMNRPALPTDLITERDLDSACAYLTKIRCEDFCKDLCDWQGISRAFIELPIDPDMVKMHRSYTTKTAPSGLISPQEPSDHSIGCPELDEQSISGPLPTQPAASSTVDPQTQHEDPQPQADTGSPPPSPVVPSMLLTILELEKIRVLQKLRDLNSLKEHANRDSDSGKKPADHDSDSGEEPASRDLDSEKQPADDDLDSPELPDERYPEWEVGLIFQRWLLSKNSDDKMEYERYRRMPMRVHDLLVHDQPSVGNSARPNGLGYQGGMSNVQKGFSSQDNESNPDLLHTKVAQKAVSKQQADSHSLNTLADSRAARRDESSRDHQPAPFLPQPALLPRPQASLGTFVNTEGLHTSTNGMPAQQVMPMSLQKRGNFASEPTIPQHHRSFPNTTIHPQQQANYMQSNQQHMPTHQQSDQNDMQPAKQNLSPAFQDQRNYTLSTQQHVLAQQQHYRDYVQPAQHHVPAQRHIPTEFQHHGGFADLVRQNTPTRFQHLGDDYRTPARQNVPTNFQHHGGFANPAQQNTPTGFQRHGDYTNPAQQNVPTGIQYHDSYTDSVQQKNMQHRSSLAKPAQQNMSTDLQHRDNFAKSPEKNITTGLQERGSPAERQPASPLVTSPKKRKSPKPKYTSMADALEDDGPGIFISVAARHAHNVLAINSGDNRISEHVSPYLARPANTSTTEPRFKPTSHKVPVTRSNAPQRALSKVAKGVIVIDDDSSDNDSEDSPPAEFTRRSAAESSLSGLRADDFATIAKKSAKPNRKRPAEDSDEDYEPRAKKPRKANPQKQTVKTKASASAAQGAQARVQTSGEAMGQQSSATEAPSQPVRRGRGRPRKYPRPEDLPAQAETSQGEQGGNLASIRSKAAPKRATVNGGKNASSNTETELETSTTEASGAFGDMSGSSHPTTPIPVKLASESNVETLASQEAQRTVAKINLKATPTEGGAALADAPSNTSATAEHDHHLPVASKPLQTSATRAFAADSGSDGAWDPASLAPVPQAPLPPANFALVAGEDTKQIGGQDADRGHRHSPPYSSYQEFWKVHENGQKFYQEATLRGAKTRDTVQGHNRLRAESDTEVLSATVLNRPAHDSLLRQATTAAALQSAAGPHSRQVPVQEDIEAQNSVGSGSDTSTREKLSLPTSKGLAPIRSPSVLETIEQHIKADRAKKAAANAEKKPETPSN